MPWLSFQQPVTRLDAGPIPTRIRLHDGTGILSRDIADGGVALAARSADPQLSGDLEPPFADIADVGLHAGTGKVLPASVDAAADADDVLGLRIGLTKGRVDLVLEPRRLADKRHEIVQQQGADGFDAPRVEERV
jgi:hypothetical protein